MTAEFDEWVAARGPGLLRLAYVLTGNRADAEDAVQDALARALPRWDHIRSVGDPDAYVRRMVVNAHTSWWRKFRKRETPVAEAFVPEAERATDRRGPGPRLACLPATARGPARGRGAALLRTARVRRDRRPDRRRRGQRPLARLPRPRRAARRRSERSTTMTDFEDRLTSALRSAGDDAPDATGLAPAAAGARGVRRRRTALTSAAAVVAVVGVVGGVALLGNGDDRTPAGRPTTRRRRRSSAPVPTRAHRVRGATSRSPCRRPLGPRVARRPGASAGIRARHARRRAPGRVGRGHLACTPAGIRRSGSSTAANTFDAAVAPGR